MTLQTWNRGMCVSFQAELLDYYARVFTTESGSSQPLVTRCSLTRYEGFVAFQGALVGSLLMLFAVRRLHAKELEQFQALGLEYHTVMEAQRYATELRAGGRATQYMEHLLREDFAPQSSFRKL